MRLAQEGGDRLGGDRPDPIDGRKRQEVLAGRPSGGGAHGFGEGLPAPVTLGQRAAGRRRQPRAGMVDLHRHRRIGPRVGDELVRQRQQLVARLGPQAVQLLQLDIGWAGRLFGRPHHRPFQVLKAVEGARQVQGRGLADVADAERDQEAVEADRAPRIDVAHQIGDRCLAVALALAQDGELGLVPGQAEDVGRLGDPALVQESLQLLLANALDVEGPPRDEVDQVPDLLEGAGELARAAARHRHRPAGGGLLHHRRLQRADADAGEFIGRAAVRAIGVDGPEDLRDHIAGPLQGHGVADADVLALDLVGVVQGGVADHHAADRHRMQPRDRGQGARTAHLDVDGLQGGGGLLGGELVGDGPAGRAGDEAETLLPVQPVDLIDHPVDVVGQGWTGGPGLAIGVQQAGGVQGSPGAVVGDEAPGLQPGQGLALGVGEVRADLAPGVGEELQRPFGGDRRIDLAQRARREVARIGIGALAGLQG